MALFRDCPFDNILAQSITLYQKYLNASLESSDFRKNLGVAICAVLDTDKLARKDEVVRRSRVYVHALNLVLYATMRNMLGEDEKKYVGEKVLVLLEELLDQVDMKQVGSNDDRMQLNILDMLVSDLIQRIRPSNQ